MQNDSNVYDNNIYDNNVNVNMADAHVIGDMKGKGASHLFLHSRIVSCILSFFRK